MLPVEPNMEIRFWNVEPLSDSESVFWREDAVFTGAEGSIHPTPVPEEPGGEKTLREDDVAVMILLLLLVQVLVRV